MKLDDFLPIYEFNEVHSVDVKAPPERVFAALKELSVAELSPLIFLMLGLRELPARLLRRQERPVSTPGPFLEMLYREDFVPLGEEPGREVVFGLIGKFWKPIPEAGPPIADPSAFLAFDDPAYAKVAANLLVSDGENGSTRCSTETRIHVPDPQTRRKFGLYWLLISLGSGWIRVLWLKAIRRKAERG
jgi:hypothetical protein